MNPHGVIPWFGAALYSESGADFAALGRVVLPSARTVLLIVADARGVPTEAIATAAERLLAAGVIYVCTWGPDCERVHDIFDEVHIGDGEVEPEIDFMSTWHDDVPLEEAIWFFLRDAAPPDGVDAATSYLAIAIGNAAWSATLEQAFSDPDAFAIRMQDDEFLSPLHEIERALGVRYPLSFLSRLGELSSLLGSDGGRHAFPDARLLLSAPAIPASRDTTPAELLPFMRLEQPSWPDIYAFDYDSGGAEPRVVIWSDHAVVMDWKDFPAFFRWLREFVAKHDDEA